MVQIEPIEPIFDFTDILSGTKWKPSWPKYTADNVMKCPEIALCEAGDGRKHLRRGVPLGH